MHQYSRLLTLFLLGCLMQFGLLAHESPAALVLSTPNVSLTEGTSVATINVFVDGDAPADAFNGGALSFAIGDGTASFPTIISFDPTGTLLDAPINVDDSTPAGFPAARLLNFNHPAGDTSEVGPDGQLMSFTVDTSGLTAGQSFALTANFADATAFADGGGTEITFSEATGPGVGTLSITATAVPEPSSMAVLGALAVGGAGLRRLRRRKQAPVAVV